MQCYSKCRHSNADLRFLLIFKTQNYGALNMLFRFYSFVKNGMLFIFTQQKFRKKNFYVFSISIMKITFCPKNQYIQSFSAKNPSVRKADDIQRKTRTTFPFFSPCYADWYYRSCASSYTGKSSADYIRHWDNVDTLERKIAKLNCIRDNRIEELSGRHDFTSKVQQTIKDIQTYGLANCEEAATLTMASMIANGFNDTHKCRLNILTEIIDRETGEVKYGNKDSLDHVLVISKTDKGEDIVIDSWYGFADSLSGAKGRYTQLTDKQKISKSRYKTINNFKRMYQYKYQSANKTFDMNNFDVKQHIDFEIKESASKQDSENLKILYQKTYPGLIF